MNSDTIAVIPSPRSYQSKSRKRERSLIIGTLVIIILSWVLGFFLTDDDYLAQAYELIPNVNRVIERGDVFIGLGEDDSIQGFAAVGESEGYGGPLRVMVSLDTTGDVIGIKVVNQKETPGFFRLLNSFKFLDQFLTKDVQSSFVFNGDIDGISGATVTTQAVTLAARKAVSEIAEKELNVNLPPEEKPIQFGGPEIVLLALFVFAYIANRQQNRIIKARMRWGTLLTGLVFLGFVYTVPLTISQIIKLLSGYWPDWQSNLYWYILIFGILFVTTVDKKNPYCQWFCPFGAFQEILGSFTKARIARPKHLKEFLIWMPRVLAIMAIILGLIFRQPGVVSYEPFAVLFDQRGTGLEWAFLILISVSSLIVYRPFCNFVCPIDPTVDFIAACRRQVISLRKLWTKEN